MIKVLQIIDGNGYGGIVKLFLDIEKYLSKEIKFDYLTATNICSDWYNLNIDRKKIVGRFKYLHRLKKFLKNNKYDVIHINTGAFFFAFTTLIVARLWGSKKVIVHSHNTHVLIGIKKAFYLLFNPLFRKLSCKHLSCSIEASKSLFNKENDVIILKNGIIIDNYKYDPKIAIKVKKELGIKQQKVYGNVSRFEQQKNHDFLIDVFYELQKDEDSLLVLVGIGCLKDKIKEKVKKLNIEDKVLFLGFRNDVNKILNCFDVVIFPSIYEGFGISLIEAQTNGVMTFASDVVPKDAKISPYCTFIDDFDCLKWSRIIKKTKMLKREKAYTYTQKKGYNIKDTTKVLECIYKDLMK